MNKTGMVLKINKNIATLVTNTGEFVNVIIAKDLPKIGDTFTGVIKKENNYIKYLAAVAVLLVIFVTGGGTAYAYYAPVATVQVSINPALELKLNRFNTVIKVLPTNNDGKTLLKNLNLKNKNIDEALTLVVEQAKKDNFINADYIEEGKSISVKIETQNSNKFIKLDKFQQYISKSKINTKVNNNGKEDNQQFTKPNINVNKEVSENNNGRNNNASNKNKDINSSVPKIDTSNQEIKSNSEKSSKDMKSDEQAKEKKNSTAENSSKAGKQDKNVEKVKENEKTKHEDVEK